MSGLCSKNMLFFSPCVHHSLKLSGKTMGILLDTLRLRKTSAVLIHNKETAVNSENNFPAIILKKDIEVLCRT